MYLRDDNECRVDYMAASNHVENHMGVFRVFEFMFLLSLLVSSTKYRVYPTITMYHMAVYIDIPTITHRLTVIRTMR